MGINGLRAAELYGHGSCLRFLAQVVNHRVKVFVDLVAALVQQACRILTRLVMEAVVRKFLNAWNCHVHEAALETSGHGDLAQPANFLDQCLCQLEAGTY